MLASKAAFIVPSLPSPVSSAPTRSSRLGLPVPSKSRNLPAAASSWAHAGPAQAGKLLRWRPELEERRRPDSRAGTPRRSRRREPGTHGVKGAAAVRGAGPRAACAPARPARAVPGARLRGAQRRASREAAERAAGVGTSPRRSRVCNRSRGVEAQRRGARERSLLFPRLGPRPRGGMFSGARPGR